MAPKLELPSLNLRELVQLRRSITVRHGLNDLQRYIDFEAFRPNLEKICKFSSKGRPHYDEVKMFKVLILQTLYDLSDEEMEYQLSDRLSFQRFIGIGYADDVPDARTIWKFRERLGAKGTKELFELFYSKMAQQGLKCSQGKLVDATFQEAPRQKNTPQDEAHIREKGTAPAEWSNKKAAHKDIEATWARKGGERHYGYKGHVLVDEGSKIIENYATTSAKVHDNKQCAELLPDDIETNKGKVLLADSGYFGDNIAMKVKLKGVKPHIAHHRVKGQEKLTKWQKKRNQAIAKRRCRIEHVFGCIKQYGGDLVRSIGLERCKIRHGLVYLLYNMKRFCFLSREGLLCPEMGQ